MRRMSPGSRRGREDKFDLDSGNGKGKKLNRHSSSLFIKIGNLIGCCTTNEDIYD